MAESPSLFSFVPFGNLVRDLTHATRVAREAWNIDWVNEFIALYLTMLHLSCNPNELNLHTALILKSLLLISYFYVFVFNF